MIVRDNIIFVHVPKTGGQSVSVALGGKSSEYSTHTPLFSVPSDGRFSFGFVRNPWDRLVSLYHFMCQKPFRKTDNFDQPRIREIGFKRWLMEDAFFMKEDGLPPGEAWRIQGAGDVPPMQRRSQLWWLDGASYIGEFEHLADHLVEACAMAGIKCGRLGHINSSDHGDYRVYYDDESAEFVAQKFAVDIAKFGYRF